MSDSFMPETHDRLADRDTDPAEYARLYALAERSYPGYSDYKAKAALVGRTLPVFRLTPLAGGG